MNYLLFPASTKLSGAYSGRWLSEFYQMGDIRVERVVESVLLCLAAEVL